MALRKYEETGSDLQDELAASLDSIQERAESRQSVVRGRLAVLEHEDSTLSSVLDFLRPRGA